MDLETECSTPELVEGNEIFPESNSHIDQPHDTIKNNGSCANEIHELNHGDAKGKGIGITGQVNSPPLMERSPGEGSPLPKGQGLRKWRRIKRDFVKDVSGSLDASKILKRGFIGSGNHMRAPIMSAGNRQNSEGSVGSVNMPKSVDGCTSRGSVLDSRMAVGPVFAATADSDNSEDRSSKSSTAASMPKMRYDSAVGLGYGRERSKLKNISGKSSGNTGQRVQQGKARIESSKKPRGEKDKLENENSQSSMESDSRSSNFVFMQGSSSLTRNGKQSRGSINFDGENSDDAHASEQQFSEDIQTGYGKENVGEIDDFLQDDSASDSCCEAKEEKCENNTSSADPDPLVDSILALQSAQEALENEVRKFGNMGKDPISLGNNSEEISDEGGASLEGQMLNLAQNGKLLERNLEEAMAMLEMKESRICELEAVLSISKSAKEDPESPMKMELEVEGFFMQKIELEVECLTLMKTLQKLRVAAGDQISLFEEQNNLGREQEQMFNKIGEAKSKASILKKQAEELEQNCEDILGTEEVAEMQKKVRKVTSCFLLQLILFIFVVWLLVLQLSPRPGMIVPT